MVVVSAGARPGVGGAGWHGGRRGAAVAVAAAFSSEVAATPRQLSQHLSNTILHEKEVQVTQVQYFRLKMKFVILGELINICHASTFFHFFPLFYPASRGYLLQTVRHF